MHNLAPRRSIKGGLPPGTPVHIGERKVEETSFQVLTYDAARVEAHKPRSAEELFPPKDQAGMTWINTAGLHEVDTLGRLGEQFGLHPLVIEDVLNTEQRPKLEDHGAYLFVVLRSLYYSKEERNDLEVEQISLILGPNYVLSFREREGDEFEVIRDRVRTGKGRIRTSGADYMAYALIDVVVDQYFAVLEGFEDRIESLEEELITDPTTETLYVIHHLKREIALVRKSMWPLRQVVGGLERSESALIDELTRPYLRDVYDHTIQVMDAVETFRDILTGMLDIYLSSVSNRMNEVMKVLTIISTLFIPLTFIAGLYGMNFRYMPELEWPWAYPAVWSVMIVIAVLMVVFFRRKRWL